MRFLCDVCRPRLEQPFERSAFAGQRQGTQAAVANPGVVSIGFPSSFKSSGCTFTLGVGSRVAGADSL
eukprot:10408744-Alexandrium_andersonii.AAC.1